MTSNLQIRAERSAEQFADKARKPLVIEFAGVPKAGKTTTLSHVQTFLKRCGFRTDVVVERASICPIRDKKHANFNIWTACTTLAQILEKTQNPPRSDDPQILFLDRGLFDSICWMTMMERISRIRPDESKLIQKFLTIDDWKRRISAVFVMLASPQDAMKREQGLLPVAGTGGSIMNSEILQQIKDINEQCVDQLGKDFRIYTVNTSDGETKGNPKRTAEVVTEAILGLIEEQIEEAILSCSKEIVTKLFDDKNFINGSQADELARHLSEGSDSDFRPREEVEKDGSRVQGLPIVIVRNVSGEVLRLRRREKRDDNLLHNKIVIWAGGHIRREDAVNGDPLIHCAIRELEEELRLQIEFSSLRLIGAVYFDNGGSTSKHVAIAYEWCASTDDVSVVLSRSEFFERRGTSLSGSFASVDELADDVEKKNLEEPWSVELVREYLAKDIFDSNPRLL